MKPRTFNSVMPINHQLWASSVLGMQPNPHKGPDLTDEKKVVEVKFALIHPGQYNHICWKAQGHQIDYSEQGRNAYWGLGVYTLDRPIKQIKTKDPKKLEAMVQSRYLWIVPWEWAKQFPLYHHSGQTELSQWDHDIFFPKGRKVPKPTHAYNVEKGAVFLTPRVNPEDFNINVSS
ncbi:MAG: hypothetical protein ABIE22_05595 [archaeon]